MWQMIGCCIENRGRSKSSDTNNRNPLCMVRILFYMANILHTLLLFSSEPTVDSTNKSQHSFPLNSDLALKPSISFSRQPLPIRSCWHAISNLFAFLGLKFYHFSFWDFDTVLSIYGDMANYELNVVFLSFKSNILLSFVIFILLFPDHD